MTRWRQSSVVTIVGISLFLAIQLATPLARLGNHDASRFGWQMFGTVGAPVAFTVHTDGGSQLIDLDLYMARIRGDMSLEDLLPPHLCTIIDDATSVTWNRSNFEC